MSPTATCLRRCSTPTSPRSASPRTTRCARARRRLPHSVSMPFQASLSWWRRRSAPNAPVPGRFRRRWVKTPNTPTSPREMPRRYANGRRWGSAFRSHRRPGESQDPFPPPPIAPKADDHKSFKQRPPRSMGPGFRQDDDGACCGRLPMTPLRAGLLAALLTLVADQASKLWLLNVFDLAHRGAVQVTPFFDLVLAWNIGISFGWFQDDGAVAQAILLIVKAVAVIVLAVWMARWSRTRTATIALGLIIGGAIGNAID